MKKNQKGFTLVEALIGVVILCQAVLAVFFVVVAIYAIGKFLFQWWG